MEDIFNEASLFMNTFPLLTDMDKCFGIYWPVCNSRDIWLSVSPQAVNLIFWCSVVILKPHTNVGFCWAPRDIFACDSNMFDPFGLLGVRGHVWQCVTFLCSAQGLSLDTNSCQCSWLSDWLDKQQADWPTPRLVVSVSQCNKTRLCGQLMVEGYFDIWHKWYWTNCNWGYGPFLTIKKYTVVYLCV